MHPGIVHALPSMRSPGPAPWMQRLMRWVPSPRMQLLDMRRFTARLLPAAHARRRSTPVYAPFSVILPAPGSTCLR
jgi:hypothetical protein